MEPTEVFPEPVWKVIFENIEDDKDKLSFLRAHSAFRNEYEKKHVELGFLFALPVLMDYFEKKTPNWCWGLNRERKQTTLSCRLASRKCSQAVDNWIESHWDNMLRPPLIFVYDTGEYWVDLTTREAVAKFKEDFAEFHNNQMPILSRSIQLSVPTEANRILLDHMTVEQELEDNERMNEILTGIGRHVRALWVDINLSHNPGIDTVENLKDRVKTYKSVLQQVPNLKSLSTYWERIRHPGWEEELLDFPDLPKLVHLSLQMEDEDGEELASDLAPFERYFPQVTHLEFFNLDAWKDEYFAPGRFPKVRHLEVFNFMPEYCNHRRKLLGMYRNLFAPNLDTFSVHFREFSKMEIEEKSRGLVKELVGMLNKLFEEGKWEGILLTEWGNEMKFKRI